MSTLEPPGFEPGNPWIGNPAPQPLISNNEGGGGGRGGGGTVSPVEFQRTLQCKYFVQRQKQSSKSEVLH